ncbi:carbohydrate porin [Nitrospirillum sp. BR 11752]|nr:carbohydrate porin [Nitrospirillum sp. BR 11752]
MAVLAMMLSSAALAAEPGTGETIDWLASYTGEAAANPSGGMRQGAAYAGQILLGADVNLNNALDWSGSTLHVAAVNRHGSNLAAQYLGSTTSLQEIYGAQNTRLARFTVEQSLLDGRLVVEGGARWPTSASSGRRSAPISRSTPPAATPPSSSKPAASPGGRCPVGVPMPPPG